MALIIRNPTQIDDRTHGQTSYHRFLRPVGRTNIVAVRRARPQDSAQQHRYRAALGGRQCSWKFILYETARKILLPHHPSSNPKTFSYKHIANSLSIYRPDILRFGARKHVKDDSIIQIISQFANIMEGVLQSTAIPWLQNIGVARSFRVEILACDFDLILPASAAVSSNAVIKATGGEERSEFAMSTFLARMPSWAHRVIIKADPEDLVRRLLPADIIPAGARHIAACFWSFLCVIDDLTEDGDCFNCIETCIKAFSNVTSLSGLSVTILGLCLPRDLSERSKLDDCKTIITAFHNVVSTTRLLANDSTTQISVIEAWKVDFWNEVLLVIKALQAEKPLQGGSFSMRDWLKLRFITISARPFMVLVRASLGLPPTLNVAGSQRIKQIQYLIQSVLGLQNDLLGWKKDHIEGNPLNSVEVLIRQGLSNEVAFVETLSAHNDIVRSMLCLSQLESRLIHSDFQKGPWIIYIQTIVAFCEGMAEWMLSSRRYRTEQVVVPGLMRLMYHDPNSMHGNIFRL